MFERFPPIQVGTQLVEQVHLAKHLNFSILGYSIWSGVNTWVDLGDIEFGRLTSELTKMTFTQK